MKTMIALCYGVGDILSCVAADGCSNHKKLCNLTWRSDPFYLDPQEPLKMTSNTRKKDHKTELCAEMLDAYQFLSFRRPSTMIDAVNNLLFIFCNLLSIVWCICIYVVNFGSGQ